MKKTWVKVLVISIAALVVLGIGAAILIDVSAARGAKVGRSEHSLTYFYADEEGATRFFFDDKLLEDRISGRVDSFLSCDGSVGVARAGTGLYRVDESGILLIYPAGVLRAAVSLNNRVVAFTTATQLHIYDHETGALADVKPEGITGIPAIAVSNDGSTVAYTVKNPDGTYEAFAYENGESRKLFDNAYVLAVSGGAKRCWFMEPDSSSLVCTKNGNKKRVAEGVSGLVEFNSSLTEAIFDISGVTWASVNRSKASVLVDGASVFSTAAECASAQGGEEVVSSVSDVSTLFGCVFYQSLTSSSSSSARTAYNVFYIDRFRHVKELVKGAYQFGVTKDGKTLSCLVDDVVYTMKPTDPSTAVKLADNVYSYCMKADGTEFYCVGRDLTLYLVEPGIAPLAVAQNVTFALLTSEGRCLYVSDFDTTGTLCSVEAHKPSVTIMDGVAYAEVMQKVCFCYTALYEDELGNKVYDVYSSPDGAEFGLALSAVLKNNTDD